MRSQNLDKILKHFLYNIFRFLSLKNSKLNIYQTSILINAENLKANSLIFLKKATTTTTTKNKRKLAKLILRRNESGKNWPKGF